MGTGAAAAAPTVAEATEGATSVAMEIQRVEDVEAKAVLGAETVAASEAAVATAAALGSEE